MVKESLQWCASGMFPGVWFFIRNAPLECGSQCAFDPTILPIVYSSTGWFPASPVSLTLFIVLAPLECGSQCAFDPTIHPIVYSSAGWFPASPVSLTLLAVLSKNVFWTCLTRLACISTRTWHNAVSMMVCGVQTYKWKQVKHNVILLFFSKFQYIAYITGGFGVYNIAIWKAA